MISREKASRGFCALSVVRESGAAFFFYFLLFFFFFWFRLTRGQGDLIETVGGGLAEFEREREKKENWNRSAFLFVRGEMKRLWFITGLFRSSWTAFVQLHT